MPSRIKNVIQLADLEATTQFLKGQSQPLLADVEPGYVHVRFQQFELGCSGYRSGWKEDGDSEVKPTSGHISVVF